MFKKCVVATVLMMAAVAVLSPVLMQPSDAVDESYYHSQLDGNGAAVYKALNTYDAVGENSMSVEVSFPMPVLFGDADSAVGYAQGAVRDALAAKYMDSPMMVYLWDLPVKAPEIEVSTSSVGISGADTRYVMAKSVKFALEVPEDMRDDAETEENELQQKMDALNAAVREMKVSGDSVSEKAKSMAGALDGIKVVADAEGGVSNIYDALVCGESSSVGIAAAFKQLCILNGVEGITVTGERYGSDDPAVWSWNMVRDDGRWYAVDVARSNQGGSGYTMAGATTVVDEGTTAFSATRGADLDRVIDNGLQIPVLNKDAYPYPDDTSFLEKYGMHIMIAAIGAVIVVFVLYAIRTGNA